MKSKIILLVVGFIIILMALFVMAQLGTIQYPDKDLSGLNLTQKTALGFSSYSIEDKQVGDIMSRCIYTNITKMLPATESQKSRIVSVSVLVRCYGGDSKADLDSKEVEILKQIADYNIMTANKTTAVIGTGKVNVR